MAVAFGIGLGFKDGVGKASEFFAGYELLSVYSIATLQGLSESGFRHSNVKCTVSSFISIGFLTTWPYVIQAQLSELISVITITDHGPGINMDFHA